MNRREFLGAGAGLALAAQPGGEWGGPVIDIHLHPRKTVGDCFVHMEGCGATKAVLLTRLQDADKARGEIAMHAGRFIWFVAADPSQPGNFEGLQKALDSGARGIGEMKNHTAADAKDMRKVYDMCAERKVPVLIHFQETSQFTKEEGWNTGFAQFDKVLKAHKKTTFIGHANFFWASISTDVARESEYPTGPVKRGGLTDKWLADFPNLWGDMSANSGNNALSRDPEFARDFVARHQNKLMFGSDCSCKDGKGLGSGALLPRLKNKCVGRDTLGLLKGLTTPEVFRKVTWTNATKLLSI
jgi:uncharacterized protein